MTTTSPTRKDKNGRRRKVTKFALAGVAVLGVGAALTSAAWTDNVWFGAAAAAGSVNLQGRVAGAPDWTENATKATALTLPASLSDLGPGQTRSITLELKNSGTVDLALEAPLITGAGALFAGATPLIAVPADVTFGGYAESGAADGKLSSNETATFTVTVKTNPGWPNSAQNKTGTLFVQVQGHT
jgi:hypothetical protein